MIAEWIPIDQVWDYDWAKAEIRRMNRTQDEADALYQRVARQRVRYILSRLVRPDQCRERSTS